MITRTVFPLVLFAFIALGATGCHHATIDTGLASSTEVIHETFAASWIYGLVPPSTISAAVKCPHGVAKVETQRSFLNSLVAIITFGIYSPMEIKVTCAAGGTSMLDGRNPDVVVGENASEVEIRDTFARAAEMAVAGGKPVYVQY